MRLKMSSSNEDRRTNLPSVNEDAEYESKTDEGSSAVDDRKNVEGRVLTAVTEPSLRQTSRRDHFS